MFYILILKLKYFNIFIYLFIISVLLNVKEEMVKI